MRGKKKRELEANQFEEKASEEPESTDTHSFARSEKLAITAGECTDARLRMVEFHSQKFIVKADWISQVAR